MLDFKLDEYSVWEKLSLTTEPIIMYGTGNGADKVFYELDRRGIKIDGVTASSAFVRDRVFHGCKVKPLSDFEEKYQSFTVIVTFGSSRPEVIENIKAINKRRRVLVPCVPVIGNEIFSREFIRENESSINKAYSLLADEKSKEIFRGYVNFEYGGELSSLLNVTTPESEAFINCIHLGKAESYIDIGAYRGDTVDKFLSLTGDEYVHITAAEPDKKTFLKLKEHCKELERFNAVNAAVTESDGCVLFSGKAGRQSAVGEGEKAPSVSLLTLAKDYAPTYIKIDSEGCEEAILGGGAAVIKQFKPKLNIAAYHKSRDIFSLPILINSIRPDYKIHLRHHPYIPAWDTLFYCT